VEKTMGGDPQSKGRQEVKEVHQKNRGKRYGVRFQPRRKIAHEKKEPKKLQVIRNLITLFREEASNEEHQKKRKPPKINEAAEKMLTQTAQGSYQGNVAGPKKGQKGWGEKGNSGWFSWGGEKKNEL